MSAMIPDSQHNEWSQPTNLATFCRAANDEHQIRMRRQGVSFHCEVDPELNCDLPRSLVRRILNAWIVEALNMMPDGGELDIVVVATSVGIEIEVADTRRTLIEDTHDAWHRQIQITSGAVVDSHCGIAIRVEAARCPQGGVARTLVVPVREIGRRANQTADGYKAA